MVQLEGCKVGAGWWVHDGECRWAGGWAHGGGRRGTGADGRVLLVLLVLVDAEPLDRVPAGGGTGASLSLRADTYPNVINNSCDCMYL